MFTCNFLIHLQTASLQMDPRVAQDKKKNIY